MKLFRPFETFLLVVVIVIIYALTIFKLSKNKDEKWNKVVWALMILLLPGLGILLFWLKALISYPNQKTKQYQKIQ